MKLIVGLGNPGTEYLFTRHNAGFRAVDILAKNLRGRELGRRWHGVVTTAAFAGEKVYILKPMTYMNDSGRAVAAAVKEINPDWEDVLIVFDDIALPLGTLRFRHSGSDGGQKGMLSILQAFGHQEVPRLRLGIGADSLLIPRDFVLQPFDSLELALAEKMLAQAAKAIELWIFRGITAAMSRYNGQVQPDE
jgi:PTH1 family peptidyl-tRNA hydrolase